MILVVGASGYIGCHLARYLGGEGLKSVGTCCARRAPGLAPFDLRSDPAASLLAACRPTHAVLCSGAFATIDGAKLHFEEAYAVNVERTRNFLDACLEAGVWPVYLSTDNVFDGLEGNYREQDERRPVNAYGRMRKEVEDHLLSRPGPWTIVRVGKVFGLSRNDGTLVSSLLARLERGEPVRCATDQRITPVEVSELCSFLGAVCRERFSGVYHVASTPAVSIFELALALCGRRRLAGALVEPCEINALGLLEPRPVNTSLDAGVYRALTGRVVREVEAYVDAVT